MPVNKARINGIDYMGGDLQQAIKTVPAEIIDNLKIIDTRSTSDPSKVDKVIDVGTKKQK